MKKLVYVLCITIMTVSTGIYSKQKAETNDQVVPGMTEDDSTEDNLSVTMMLRRTQHDRSKGEILHIHILTL